MKDMVQRYVHLQAVKGFVAGVYTGTVTLTLTPKFNITLNFISVGMKSYDLVTFQAIEGHSFTELTLPVGNDNPAITSTGIQKAILVSKSGQVNEMPLHQTVAANKAFTLDFVIFLLSVTANNLNSFNYVTLGYMAPEDYLSVDLLGG